MLKKFFIFLILIFAVIFCGLKPSWALGEKPQKPKAKIIEGTTLYNRQQFFQQHKKTWQDASPDEQRNFLKSTKKQFFKKNAKGSQNHKSIFSAIKSTASVPSRRKRHVSIAEARRNFSQRVAFPQFTMGRSNSFLGLKNKVQQRFGRRMVFNNQLAQLKRRNFLGGASR